MGHTTTRVRGAAATILVGAVVCCARRHRGRQYAGPESRARAGCHALQAASDASRWSPWLERWRFAPGAQTTSSSPTASALPPPRSPTRWLPPQATLMQSVADGIFRGGLPWTMVGIGAVIARYHYCDGRLFKKPKFYVSNAGAGPWRSACTCRWNWILLSFVGGLIAWAVERYMQRNTTASSAETSAKSRGQRRKGGPATRFGDSSPGEALMGIAHCYLGIVAVGTGVGFNSLAKPRWEAGPD